MSTFLQQLNANNCSDYQTILANNGSVIENQDGSVSVFIIDNVGALVPSLLSKVCCEVIKPNYIFDIDTQKCRWAPVSTGCSLSDSFKLVLNPKGNDGTLFFVEENDNCSLNIVFNYLFKIKCGSLSEILIANTPPCSSPISVFESFDVSLTLDVVTSANTLQTLIEIPLFPAIGSGNLYNYLVGTDNSGFYVCGDSNVDCIPLILNLSGLTQQNDSTCNDVMNNIIEGLFDESGLSGTSNANNIFISSLPSNALASNWLHFTTAITDTIILSLIANQKIKISIKINNTCSDFCVLIDEISLNKDCTHIERNDIFLTKSPGFELDRIRDNKKSWVDVTSQTNRPFAISNNEGNNLIRKTNYDVNDERLIINSKEIDLDISLASAIETDIWSYIIDNPCLLTGSTCVSHEASCCGNKSFMNGECFYFMNGNYYAFMSGTFTGATCTDTVSIECCNPCTKRCCGDGELDFNSLMTQPLSGITTIEDFEYFLTSELIDVKSRKTLSGYPTLRALYDRYINSSLYCSNKSSGFDYLTMDQFAGLVGNYWVDIVEQVIPATTIWGSVKIYSNTIFDQQKYKYKSYSSLFCGNPFSGQTISSPINGTSGTCVNVSVITTPINIVSGDNLKLNNPVSTYCENICLAQMNIGSEFIGTVSIVGSSASACDMNNNTISEGITISVILEPPNASLNVIGATGPLAYLWSNGATGATTTMSAGDYSVTIVDINCNQASVDFTMPS